eukprot:Nk52_evm3s2192 gene=Nk52_evmTU3s2192
MGNSSSSGKRAYPAVRKVSETVLSKGKPQQTSAAASASASASDSARGPTPAPNEAAAGNGGKVEVNGDREKGKELFGAQEGKDEDFVKKMQALNVRTFDEAMNINPLNDPTVGDRSGPAASSRKMPSFRGTPLSAVEIGEQEDADADEPGIGMNQVRAMFKKQNENEKGVELVRNEVEKRFGISSGDWDMVSRYFADYEEVEKSATGKESRVFANRILNLTASSPSPSLSSSTDTKGD